ncbi:hypothetical protein C1752_17472 [Acaryochloris thomasi RCC1774]|uniref:Uncharacterized protein n=1 Tax=Acaryochloris thomasi RCC1774 TaxID=1764569 RepID=A0A2W1J7D3_9CYAN|nr:hypothetical protein C1752_17472 [Acaryochloris thomasi RCC1774]
MPVHILPQQWPIDLRGHCIDFLVKPIRTTSITILFLNSSGVIGDLNQMDVLVPQLDFKLISGL